MPESARRRSVVLLSGGLDSAANLALCAERDEPVLAITCRYGQRAAVREVEAGRALARHFGVKHEVVSIEWLGALGGSSLTDTEQNVPDMDPATLDDAAVTRESARSVWVPNRNGILINVAAAYAERLGAGRIVVGFNREEAATFPDNSTAYLRAASEALAFSTATQARVHCYTDELDKREIVRELRRMSAPFPFHLVWSCYYGFDKACGGCESCRRFERATRG